MRSSRQAIEGQVFALETADAKRLVSPGFNKFTEDWLENLFLKYPIKAGLPQDLPPGHYISTQIVGNQVNWQYIQVPNCDVYVENDQQHLMLKVLDADGMVIPDALIKLGDLILPFDPLTQTYKTDEAISSRLLEVEVNGVTQFHNLSRVNRPQGQLNQSRPQRVFQRWVLKPFQGWILKPIVLTMTLPYDLVRSAVKLRLFGWPAFIAFRVKQVVNLGRRVFGGANPVTFVVCSQPRYRPRDTVKVKAYLTERDGDRLRTPLGLYYTDKSGTPRLAIKMNRLRPGCYIAQFILSDTLNLALDRAVPITLQRMRGFQKGKVVANTTFYYEDYELNQYTFAMRAESETHWQGKQQALLLEAKDMNGLTVPDARAKVCVLSQGVDEWQRDRGFIPDTLLYWSGNLDAAGETRISLPESLFHDAAFHYSVVADCWTSDNERKSQSLNLAYLHDKGELKMTQQGPWLQVDYLFHGVSTPKEAEINLIRQGCNASVQRKLPLPARIFLSPAYRSLYITTEGLAQYWNCPTGAADLNVVGHHAGDSIALRASTKSGLEFSWHLFEANKEVASGHAAQFSYFAKTHPNKTYYLNIHGIFGGQSFSEDYTFHCPANALQVNWSGPSTIYPGMTADMKLQVNDRRGRPVNKADITAYAVNSRFEGAGKPSVSVRGERVKARKRKSDYHLAPTVKSAGTLPLHLEKWVLSSRIDTLAWYQFLYPGQYVYQYQHRIDSGSTEFAPYVVKNGAIQPVQMIYLDGHPIFFAWSQPQQPYSFPISPDRHHMVEMRLPDNVVRIEIFSAPKGYKTILSVDVDHVPQGVKSFPMAREANPAEQSVIRMHTFGYRRNNLAGLQLISFGNRVFPMSYGQGIAGPAVTNYNTPIRLEHVGSFFHEIDYEPNFEFDFGPKTVKMRTLNEQYYPKAFNYQPTMPIEDRAWRRDSMVAQFERGRREPTVAERKSLNFSSPQYSSWYYGRLILQYEQPAGVNDNPRGIIFHDEKKGEVYVLQSPFMTELWVPAGKWGFYLMLENERYVALDSIEIRPYGRNFARLRYQTADIQDSIPQLISKLIAKQPNPSAYYPGQSSQDGKDYYDPSGGYYPRWNTTRHTNGRTMRVSGTVLDSQSGEPMIAAMVYCQGFGVGTYTDYEGHYSMNVPIETDSIFVQYLGYATKLIIWDGKPKLDISLVESSLLLNETIVITAARHQQDLMSVSASMDVISVKKVDLQMSSNLQDALVQMPGLDVIDAARNGSSTTELTPAFPAELMAELEGKSVIRKDFRDNAIWEPALRSDRKGTGSFRVKFPEDITRWDAYAVAVDRRGRTGATAAFVKSWKPLAGRLALPRFLTSGDTCLAIGKVMNYTGQSQQMRRRFTVDGQTVQEKNGNCGPVQLDTLSFSPTPGADSLKISYLADKTDGYGDGEELGIRVFPVGMLDTRGIFASLIGDTTLQTSVFDPAGGPVLVRATAKFQELLLNETQRLQDYSHLCNEQLSSKLIGLLSEEQIFQSLDRPWKGKDDVQACIRLLEKRISPQNGVAWGWWPGMKPEIWVSLHVTQALIMAQKQGYKVTVPMLQWVPSLILHLDYKWYNYSNIEALQLIQAISPELDIRNMIQALDTLKFNRYQDKLAIMELRQTAGMPIDLDSLQAMANWYLKFYRPNYQYGTWNNWPYSSPYCALEPVLTAYRILRRAGKTQTELFPYLRYLLASRGYYGWGNTYLTAKVLMTLIPDIGAKAILEKPKVTLNIGGEERGLTFDSTLVLEHVPDTLFAHKEGSGLVFFTAYQRWFNAHPQRTDSLFDIQTTFLGSKASLHPDSLFAGEPVTLHVTFNVKRNLDYVMLEVPIPAGCSYGTKSQGYYWYGRETYREYFREKVACYYRYLPAGEYVIDIQLQPRYNGRYVLNCAHAEQMYLPMLSGNNEVRPIQIGAGF